MRTMHPAIVAGQHTLAASAIDPVVFEERQRAVEQALAAAGYDGLVIHGDAQDASAMAYLTHYMPRMRWAVALLAPGAAPRLYVAGPERDLPFVRDMTPVEALRPFEAFEADLPAWAAGLVQGRAPRLAACNLERAREPVAGPVARLSDSMRIDAFDAVLDGLAAECTPLARQKILDARALIVRGGEAAAATATPAGQRAVLASMEFERQAYQAGAYQVQTLYGDGTSLGLAPYDGHDDIDRATPRAYLYAALKSAGYAADAFVALGTPDAELAEIARSLLDGLREAARPGIEAGQLKARLREQARLLGVDVFDDELVASLGLRLATLDDADRLAAGRAYSLKLGIARQGVAHFDSTPVFP